MSYIISRNAGIPATVSASVRTLGVLATAAMFCAGISVARADKPRQDPTAPAALAAPLAVDWKYTGTSFPNNPASPIADSDRIYFASGARVYAVSKQTGSVQWTYPSDGFMPSPVQATPALSNGTLFLPTGDGLYALNAADGKLKYPAFKLSKGGVATHPAVIGAGVYIGSPGGLIYGINAETGDPLSSQFQTGLNVGAELIGDIANQNGTLYFVTSNQILHAVDAAAGVQKWARRVEGATDGAYPVVAGDTLYLAVGQLLYSFRAESGQPNWTLTTRNVITAPPAVDADGNIYIVTAALGVYALDARKQLLWKQVPQVDYDVDAQPIITGKLLILGTSEGGLYAFDRTNGDLKWNFAVRPTAIDPTQVPLFNKVSNPPVIADDRLFVLTDDGSLTAFRHNAADTLPPNVTGLMPDAGEYCNGRPPFTIRARIVDDGSGLQADSVTLKLDDQQIARRAQKVETAEKPGFTFDKDTGILEYNILESETGRSKTLVDGHHTVTLTARDWKGNLQTRVWTFTIDDTLPKEKDPYAQQNNRNGGRLGGNGPGGTGGGRGGGGGIGGFGGGGGGRGGGGGGRGGR